MTIESLYDQHVDAVYTFFYAQCPDRGLAEDLTSQTFMALCENMQNPGRVINDYKKFLYGIMRNVWLMHLRKKYRQKEMAVEDVDDFAVYVEETVEEYEALSVRQRAEIYINRLPEKQRLVVAQRLLYERSIKQICEESGKDSNYVKTTYKRGLKRLKELVAEGIDMAGITVPVKEEIV